MTNEELRRLAYFAVGLGSEGTAYGIAGIEGQA